MPTLSFKVTHYVRGLNFFTTLDSALLAFPYLFMHVSVLKPSPAEQRLMRSTNKSRMFTCINILSKVIVRATSPFLLKLNYAFHTDTRLMLVMDYMCGGSLEHNLSTNSVLHCSGKVLK